MTPLERAGKAIYDLRPIRGWINDCRDFGKPPVKVQRDITWEAAPPDVRKGHIEQARAVIAAIREPSQEVAQRAFRAGACGGHVDCWHAMIDQLLAEG